MHIKKMKQNIFVPPPLEKDMCTCSAGILCLHQHSSDTVVECELNISSP